MELLSDESVQRVELIRVSMPVPGCGRCEYHTGCPNCDWRKLVRYLRAKDLGGLRLEGYDFRFATAGEKL